MCRWHWRCSLSPLSTWRKGVSIVQLFLSGPCSALVLGLRALATLLGSREQQAQTSPECATLAKKAQSWGIALFIYSLLIYSYASLLFAFSGGWEWNVVCCMTDRPSSSSANLGPYFERPLKEKGLCALWMQGCWTAANPRLLHSKGWVNKWE